MHMCRSCILYCKKLAYTLVVAGDSVDTIFSFVSSREKKIIFFMYRVYAEVDTLFFFLTIISCRIKIFVDAIEEKGID